MSRAEGRCLAPLALASLLTWQAPLTAKAADVPEFFGLYADVPGGLRELQKPEGMAARPKDATQARAMFLQTLKGCISISGPLRLVLYDDRLAPSEVGLLSVKLDKQVPVEWRVAPLGGKPGMFRLAPRVDPPADFYHVFAGATGISMNIGNFGAKYQGCVLLNITADEYVEGVMQGSRPSAATPTATSDGNAGGTTTTPPAGGLATPSSSSSGTCSGAQECADAGRTAMRKGRFDESFSMWDKALDAGGVISFSLYRKRTFGADGGVLSVGKGELRLAETTGREVFTAPTGGATCVGPRSRLGDYHFVEIETGGKKYQLIPVPEGNPERAVNALPPFSAWTLRQQEAVGRYICTVVTGPAK